MFTYLARSFKNVNRVNLGQRVRSAFPSLSRVSQNQSTAMSSPSDCQSGGKTKIVDVSKGWDDVLCTACEVLQNEGVLAVPTDTIYGIAVHAQSTSAVSKLYQIKGRDQNKPISICVSDVTDVCKWANVTVSDSLLSSLLPGPVTVVFERNVKLNTSLNSGTSLVGVRVPDHGFIRELCRAYGKPLALTSANKSSHPSALNIGEFEELWPNLDLICDGGSMSCTPLSRAGSTVVNLSQKGLFTVIRPGSACEQTVSLLRRHGLEEELKSSS